MNEHRVVGPPGTGKTTYLKRQFERAAERFGVENVYACSLTKTASAEIASRVEGVPPTNIGTLHSHAYRLLKYPRIVETTSGLKEWNEFCGANSYRISAKHAANPENAAAEPAVVDSDGAELMQQMGVLRQRMVPVEAWPGSVKRFHKRWQEFKLASNRVDFTDLIEGALGSVDRIPGCRVLFVDEAQDMSKLEFALARKWGSKADELVIVGDPDQNLYEWRGSDPAAFYADNVASEHVLAQSYRVPKAPHQAARQWIAQIPDRIDAAYDPTGQEGACARIAGTWKDPVQIVEHALSTLGDGPDLAERSMILASCGYMLNPTISILRARGVPFHNPYRSGHGAWNPLRGSRRLLAFLRPDREVWGSDARMWTWGDLKAWSEVLVADGTFVRGFKTKVEVRCTPRDRFGDTEEDQPCDVNWLLEMCADDEVRSAVVDLNIDWWESRLRHNDKKSQQFALTVARRFGGSRLLEQPRLIVGTIHSVKGGEADHVYLFPDLSPVGYWDGWKARGSARNAIVRQFYVGMTRTKNTLHLCDAASDLSVVWNHEASSQAA